MTATASRSYYENTNLSGGRIMRYLVLTSITLLALSAPAAFAGTEIGLVTIVTDGVLVNSQTGAPIIGCPQILRLTLGL